MKKILSFILVVLFSLMLVGCGDNTKDNNNNNGEYKGSTEGGKGLESVTDKNYKEVAKDIFGMEIDDQTGWTLLEAKSPNSVNNLNIKYTVSNGSDGKEIVKSYFNKSMVLSTKVYAIGYNEDYTALVKSESYTDYDAYSTSNVINMYGLTQGVWLYDFGEKTVQFSISVSETTAEITFVLIS